MSKIEDKRDHRNIAKELDLYSSYDEIGQGLICYHPNGAIIRYEMERFSQKAHLINGYDWVYSPHFGLSELWRKSGHLDFFRENMYDPFKVDNEEYCLKPMNCPFHIMIFNKKQRSYNELPVRYAEFGSVYRYEYSGALQGLKRLRGFVQDDAHIICGKDQIGDELDRVLKFCMYVLKAFGIEKFKAYIASKPKEKAIGSDEDWRMAEDELRRAVSDAGLEYEIDEGGGAFYGPKIDLKIIDYAGNEWQCSTIQFDFNLPGRFDMKYRASDGEFHRPYMIHRALFGSFERFIASLLEFYNGNLPLWLSPVQMSVINVGESQRDYCKKLVRKLKSVDIRVEFSDRNESLSSRIRDAELRKVPLIVVIGDAEVENNLLSVRCKFDPQLKGQVSYDKLLEIIRIEQNKGKPQVIFED
jgi:threonyl-tRNA synthetase